VVSHSSRMAMDVLPPRVVLSLSQSTRGRRARVGAADVEGEEAVELIY
jgi:hypothetical protein